MRESKYTDEFVDNALIENNINFKRIGSFIPIKKHMEFECLKCNHVWKASPHTIINGKSGCAKCAGTARLTNDIIDNFFIKNNIQIKRLDEYENSSTTMNWQCLICDYVWPTRSRDIYNGGTGCPKCAGCAKITNEEIDFRLIVIYGQPNLTI